MTNSASIQQIKWFIIRLLIVVIVLFACDRGTGWLLKYFYFKQKSGLLYRTTYAIDSTTAEILVFGSSRANHHYVPAVFEERLGHTFYNSGRDGSFLLSNYGVFKAVINRYRPVVVIFDLNPEEIGYAARNYERLSDLLPYYQGHPEIRSVVSLRGPFEKFKMISAIYPYNSLLTNIILGNLDLNKSRNPDDRGYIPIAPGTVRPDRASDLPERKPPDDAPDINMISALQDIIRICEQKQIKLLFVQSPHQNIRPESRYDSIFSEICAHRRVDYCNMSDSLVFKNHPALFNDSKHLNANGAYLFSKMVSARIKETFKK